MIRSTRWVAALAALTVLAIGTTAQAQVVKPIKIRGSGVGPDGLPLPGQPSRSHTIEGNATHLGRHTGAGEVLTASAVIQPDGSVTGTFGSAVPFVFKAANGDELACNYGRDGNDYVGTFLLVPLGTPGFGELYVAYWIADFEVLPEQSTGRFAGVTGSWTMFATSSPFRLATSESLDYSWQGQGELTFPVGP